MKDLGFGIFNEMFVKGDFMDLLLLDSKIGVKNNLYLLSDLIEKETEYQIASLKIL